MNTNGVGNCLHEPWVMGPGYKTLSGVELDAPVVMLANDDDSHYATEYNSWSDVNELIAKLREAAHEAFGEEPQA